MSIIDRTFGVVAFSGINHAVAWVGRQIYPTMEKRIAEMPLSVMPDDEIVSSLGLDGSVGWDRVALESSFSSWNPWGNSRNVSLVRDSKVSDIVLINLVETIFGSIHLDQQKYEVFSTAKKVGCFVACVLGSGLIVGCIVSSLAGGLVLMVHGAGSPLIASVLKLFMSGVQIGAGIGFFRASLLAAQDRTLSYSAYPSEIDPAAYQELSQQDKIMKAAKTVLAGMFWGNMIFTGYTVIFCGSLAAETVARSTLIGGGIGLISAGVNHGTGMGGGRDLSNRRPEVVVI